MDTTLTIKIPKKVKEGAKRVADELGIPLTTVVNSMLSKFTRDKEITFSVYPTPKPEKLAEWEKVSDDMDAHPEKYPSYSVEEFIAKMNTVRKRHVRARARK